MKDSKLIGKLAYITNRDSWYYSLWGKIIAYDGDVYYIAIANDTTSVPVFDRNEFTVRRNGDPCLKQM